MRRLRRRSPVETAADITIDWHGLMDGRAHRVARGRDFSCTLGEFNEAARQAAELAGKRLRATRDRIKPRHCTWVQFADGEIRAGEPCRCGSTNLERVGVTLARCQSCGSTFIVVQPPEEGETRPPPARAEVGTPPGHPKWTLDDFSDVRLECYSSAKDERRYVGFGIDDNGDMTLLVVRMPIVEGARLPDTLSRLDAVHEVVFAKPFPGAEALTDRRQWETEWEIVL